MTTEDMTLQEKGAAIGGPTKNDRAKLGPERLSRQYAEVAQKARHREQVLRDFGYVNVANTWASMAGVAEDNARRASRGEVI